MTSAPRQLPEQIGPYRIVDVLGEGGMGVIYRAESERGQVAVKTVRAPNERMLSRMRREILALRRVQHPGIVRLEDSGLYQGLPWYAMELLEGKTLRQHLRQLWPRAETLSSAEKTEVTVSLRGELESGPTRPDMESAGERISALPDPVDGQSVDPSTSLRFAQDERWQRVRREDGNGQLRSLCALAYKLCVPLAHIHHQGVVHCDLKPSNVFVLHDGRVVLIDFGLVARSSKLRETLEIGGEAVGTATFMAPEQIRGDDVDARADLYALGCILYECLVGCAPFSAANEIKLFDLHLHAAPIPPSQRVHGVPPALDHLVLSLLAKHARDRPASAEHVAALLAEFAGASETVSSLLSTSNVGPLYRPELAGRVELIDKLENDLLDACRKYSVLFVGAKSGMGKTRLCSELGRRARSHKLGVVTGECLPGGAPLHPLLPLLQAVGDYCRSHGKRATSQLLGKHGKLLASIEPSLRALEGVEAQPAPPPLPAEEARRRLFEALSETLQLFLNQQPMLIILDDLQWADELTREFLRRPGDTLFSSTKSVLIAAYRSEEATEIESLFELPASHRVDLQPLDETAVGAIVADMLGLTETSNALAALVRFLTLRSEGNPFFVAEYLRLAAEEGVLERDQQGRFRLRADLAEGDFRPAELALPASLRELVSRRLEVLPRPLAEVVEFTAVLGREASDAMLAAACTLSPDETTERVRQLVARQIFEDRAEGQVCFVHDKLWEVAYEQIPGDRRQTLHLSAAQHLENQHQHNVDPYVRSLARHHDRGGNARRAIDYYERAAEQATEAFSNQEAILYFRRALELSRTLPKDSRVARLRRSKWHGALCNAYLCSGKVAKAVQHGERTLRGAGRRLPKSKIGLGFGALLLALRIVGQHVWPALFRKRDPEKQALMLEAAGMCHRLTEAFVYENDVLNGIYCGLLGVRLAIDLPPSPALARVLSMMCPIAGMIPLHAVARAWRRRGRQVASAFDDPDLQAYCLSRTGVYSVNVAEWEDVDQSLERSQVLSNQIGNRRTLEESTMIHAISRYYRGQPTVALTGFRQALASTLLRRDLQMAQSARSGVAQCSLRLGRNVEALQALNENLANSDTATGQFWSTGLMAQALTQTADSDNSLSVAEAALAAMKSHPPMVYWLFPGIVGTCEALWVLLGRQVSVAASSHMRSALERAVAGLEKFARLMKFAEPSVFLFRAYLQLHHRPHKAALNFARALKSAQDLAMPYEQARAHLELSRLDPDERALHLTAAEEIFVDIGCLHELGEVRSAKERNGC